MVTVIANKEELATPVNNGVTTDSPDHERTFQYIKDYQEVDFHRSPSCKLLPEDLADIAHDPNAKSSIKGTFFVQIDFIESIPLFNINTNIIQSQQNNEIDSLLLTLTDGITTVKGVTNDFIPNLSCNVRPGSKLLLTGMILIKDGSLQLTHDNTRFQYGSNTYPRPRSAYRGRGGGSYRHSYEGRRGGAGNSNSRYENDNNTSNILKGPPPKQTLMDFMTSLNISNDIKSTVDNDNQKSKDRYESKRRNTEQYCATNRGTNSITTMSDSNHNYSSNNDNNNDQITLEQDGNIEQLDLDDDSLHANYRERRNPLPPRLQRAQEERTRRNTNRYYDDSMSGLGGEINGNYRNGTIPNSQLSSASSYSRCGDATFCMTINNPSSCPPHAASLGSYTSHGNMLAPAIGSTAHHLTYFTTNPGPLSYGLGGIPSSPFHSQTTSMNPGYTNDHLGFRYRAPFVNPAYASSTVTNDLNEDSKNVDSSSDIQANATVDGNEIKTTDESQKDDNNNDSNINETKSQSTSVEQKAATSSSSSSSSSSNDGQSHFQQVMIEQLEEKRRDSNSNSRIRWKIGDICLARWSEDQEYYAATIFNIQPPYCTVIFRDYNNYDKVHFSDLKILPRDQQYYPYVPAMTGPTSDSNILAPNVYFPSPTNYYPPTIDGCIIMPEPPPFPFNSAGTLYMCPPTVASISRSNRYHTNGLTTFQHPNRRFEHGNLNHNNHVNNDIIIDSSSTQSKESNDESIIDSTTVSIDDNQHLLQQQDMSFSTKERRSCSITDTPIRLTTSDDDHERSTSAESLTSSKFDEQQLTNEEKQGNNPMVNTN